MGYSEYGFGNVQHWLNEGWIKPGGAVLEFGAQEFMADLDKVHRELRTFLAAQGLPEDRICAVLGDGLPPVRAIYEAAGIKYESIDVDGAHGSQFFDLNTSEPPRYWRGAFDFINNEGTTEHLVNPINGFHVAHDIVRVGGVIRHNVPLIGWPDHGFLYPTTKFYAHMIGDNGYELLKAKVFLTKATPFDDPMFKEIWDVELGDYTDVKPTITNLWGELVYRKTVDRPFMIPVDHVGGPAADAVRARLIESYSKLTRARPYPFTL
jgi:hypothetical protein